MRGGLARRTAAGGLATLPGLCERPRRPAAETAMVEVTQLIGLARAGDGAAAAALFAAVYAELKRLAAIQVARGDGGGLGDTSLVHEAYLRFARPGALAVNDRGHFFVVAARAMRQIAVDHARERLAAKRGGGAVDLTLGAAEREPADLSRHEQLVTLNDALEALASVDARLARLVELRWFAGCEWEDVAEQLGVSLTTVKRDFRRARAFLHARLGAGSIADVD